MHWIIRYCLIVSVAFLSLKCKDEPTKPPVKPPEPTVNLTIEDASCTEVWLKLSVTNVTNPAIVLKRDDATIDTLCLTTADTTIVDENLLPSHTYTYAAQILNATYSSTPTQARTMDTTSHNFTFQTFTLGDGTGSSILYDVAIINDTLAYAVGQIYRNDTTFNLARWDGREWVLMKILFRGPCSAVDYPLLKSIWVFTANNILVTNGGSIVRYDGTNTVMDCGMNSLLTGAINRIFATSQQDIYLVGNTGTIVHYDGTSWTKMESGTSLQILDIYGAKDSKTGEQQILAVATQNYPAGRAILSIKGNTCTEISSVPIGSIQEFFSVWFVPNRHYYVIGDGIYEKLSLADNLWKNGALDITRYATTSIRGNGLNNVYAVGAYGEWLHYNGKRWRSYHNITALNNGSYASIAVKGTYVIAVGYNNAQAIITISKNN